jgi:hypothetical protein
MKLLSKDLLIEFGFIENKSKINNNGKVMSRDNLDIVVKYDGSFFYSEKGIDYYLRDTASLKRKYKEINIEDLKPIK